MTLTMTGGQSKQWENITSCLKVSILLNLISFINVFPQQSIDVLNTNVVALNSSVLTLITIMGRTDRDHHQLMGKSQ